MIVSSGVAVFVFDRGDGLACSVRLLGALSWLGWRWNQVEIIWANSGRLPYVKRMRQRSKRRKHHH